MRAALDGIGPPDHHVGLAYDRWAPLDVSTGKIPDARRRNWLRELANSTISDDYQHAYNRWSDSLKTAGTRLAEVELASRLLVGHGNPSPTEVGLTVHHTWGVPMIPGTALKGLLNHYVDAKYGPAVTGLHPMDPNFPEGERDRAPFRGVTWVGKRIEHGPGEVHRALFGAPRARTDPQFEGAGETAGLVVFHDALFVPESAHETPYSPDVLTVHQKSYYDSQGKSGPNDYDNPIPVSFLTVRPGTKFLVALEGPDDWTRLAFDLLRDALREWGVGGKTTSGYGQFRKWTQTWPVEAASVPAASPAAPAAPAPAVSSPIVDELRAWLTDKTQNQRDKLEKFRSLWLPRCGDTTPAEKQQIARLLRSKINNDRLAADRDQLIRNLLDE